MSIAKRIALITGSAQGIGRGVALRLAKDGNVEKIGRKTLIVPADVSVEDEVDRMVQDVSKELGSVDVMVANAGIARAASVVSTPVEDWDQVMAVNARGPFLCYKYAARQMIKQGRGGRIIGISSILGKRGTALFAAYSASKFAIRGLTHAAALELGRYNITVNCCAPGVIQTPIFNVFNDVIESDSDLLKVAMDNMAANVIKHEGQPEDVAGLVSYLASKESLFITGQTFTIDGGVVLS